MATSLLRALGLNQAPRPYEPKPRFDSLAVAVDGQCVVFAGRTADFDKTKGELSRTVEVFDQYLEKWKALKTTGSPPKGLFACGSCVSPSGDLYAYGGCDGLDRCGGLYKLSSLKWSQISAESDPKGPMKKSNCGMIYFKENKIAVIGGLGVPRGPLQPGASFVETIGIHIGWTNEIHVFDTKKCKCAQLLICHNS